MRITKVDFSPAIEPIRMRVHWLYRAIYVFGVLFFSLVAVAAAVSGDAILVLCITTFAISNVFGVILARSYVEVDRHQVLVHNSPFGDFAIKWRDIEAVETNGMGYVFRGSDKALGFNALMGDGQSTALRMQVEELIELHGIVVRRVTHTPITWPRNTRVIRQ